MATLFTSIDRTDDSVKPYGEASFSYLDRSARTEACHIRHVLENWYQEYPDESGDLRSRFRLGDEITHVSSAFELYMHQLLCKLGYSTTVHPETLTNTATKPDFLAISNSNASFYLEAVLATDSSKEKIAADKRMAVLYDQIEKIKNRDFFLLLDVHRKPNSQPSGKKLRNMLENWLDTLNPEIIPKDEPSAWPRYEWEREGWRIGFTALPRPPHKRGKKDIRIIGLFRPEARWVSTWESIRDSVVKKGKRYGELDRGLVVAVNVGSIHLDRNDEMQALFGQEKFIITVDSLQDEPEFRRAPNGAWYGPKGPRYTRVSAVMLFRELHPWTFGVRGVTTYLNPWAQYPIDGPLLELDYAKVKQDGQMEWIDRKKPFEVLDLPEGWPEVGSI